MKRANWLNEATLEHLALLQERADRLDRQGFATEKQTLDARYELAFAVGLIASGIVGGALVAHLMRLRAGTRGLIKTRKRFWTSSV